MKLQKQPNPKQPVAVTHCILVKKDLTWQVSIHGHIASNDCAPFSTIPQHLTLVAIQLLLTVLDTALVCAGHPDEHLVEMAKVKKGTLLSKNGKEVHAALDSTAAVYLNGVTYTETIRSTSCQLLVYGSKCTSCVAYHNTLRSIYNQWKRKKAATTYKGHTNTRFLNSPQKKQRISEWKSRAKAAEKKVCRLEERIRLSKEINGIDLDEGLHDDLSQIIMEKTGEIQAKYDKESFQRLFWEQQLQAIKAKSPTQYRWHPMMVKWCLHLRMLSSFAYDAMHSSGFIVLPSQRTPRDYTRWIKSGVGIQPEVTTQLINEAHKCTDNEDLRHHIAVVFDEMKVKEGIVYDKHECRVVGFVNLGDVNNQLLNFERHLQGTAENTHVAKQVLVFMVRGIFTRLTFPYAQFRTAGISADLLFPLLWNVIRHLECAGFKVLSVTGDKASANRKLFRMHKSKSDPQEALVHKVQNPFSEEERFIYFFSDVPHLIKTVRNCWSNSFGHSHKRPLWVSNFNISLLLINYYIQINGQHISWEHLRRVYSRSQTASGLSLLPKLTREHMELNSYSRMRVNLAAQVC